MRRGLRRGGQKKDDTVSWPTSSDIIYAAFLIFFSYFLVLTANYLFLAFVGLFETRKRAHENENENYPLLYLSSLTIPVSIVIPAHNEEEWIKDCLLSLLNLDYPKFEIIIVEDCSTDGTFGILDSILKLHPIDVSYAKHYKDGKVASVLRGEAYPNVTVIRKPESGLKKAGAVNAGLNIAKYEYVCVTDADTILEPDALLKVMAQIEKDSEHTVGVGSYFGLVNGLNIKNGRIIERSFSYNPIVAYQNLEYMRSFIGNRVAWSRFNAMPNVAGGFGVWNRNVLYDLGGYSTDFTCEDIELTFRVHDYSVKNGKNYKILMFPYYVGWTEGPSNVRSLISQRERWQRVVNETIWSYRHMILNPKYGAFAFLTLPYFVLYEVLGVFFEIASVAFVTIGWLKGVLDIRTFLAFLALMLMAQTFISLLCLLAFIRNQKLFSLRYIAYLILLSITENFWYRWLISAAKFIGTFEYLRGKKTYDMYVREKRK